MTLTPEQLLILHRDATKREEQLRALELAHDAVRDSWANYSPYRDFPVMPGKWSDRTDKEVVAIDTALDTLTAAIEALKNEGRS